MVMVVTYHANEKLKYYHVHDLLQILLLILQRLYFVLVNDLMGNRVLFGIRVIYIFIALILVHLNVISNVIYDMIEMVVLAYLQLPYVEMIS